ncbi:MAG: hypothetical protein FJ304_12620 [Planctomycetes bacterium]|nr:hypothetical protein [Planctomycetota bacterium]
MPIRLTCPSCSTALSVKDEFAGRAVKCPKCNGVIPGSRPAAPAPAPPADPPHAPPKATPVPGKPVPPRAGGEPAAPGAKIKGKPVAGGDWAEPVDDDEPAPRRKRPARRRDDDDYNDRPARRDRGPAGSGGGAGVVLIICCTVLLVCGGLGYGVYRFVIGVKETVEKGADDIQRAFSPVTLKNYEQLVIGKTTRADAEKALGAGRMATPDDIETAFPNDLDKVDRWMSLVFRNRAVIWQKDDDRLLCAFHPNAEGAARLQMKEWRPKNGAHLSAGEQSDTEFVRKYPPPDPNAPKPSPPQAGDKTGPVITVSAADLIDDYKNDRLAADKRYLSKRLLVTGVVDSWENDFTAHVVAPDKPTIIRVVFLDEQRAQIANYKKGDTIRFRGTLTSGIGIMAVNRGWIVP